MIGVSDLIFGDANLHNELHISKIFTNLFLVSRATSKGVYVYFDDDFIKVIDP